MDRRLAFWICVVLVGGAGRGAAEVFPVEHNEPLVVRVLGGKDGAPQARVRLFLEGGYDRRDLKLGMWHQEAITDGDGVARLSNALRNLPLLHLEVENRHACGVGKGEAVFNVGAIRRDGLHSENRCGRAVAEDKPGIFTVFVKGKRASAAVVAVPVQPDPAGIAPRPTVVPVTKEPPPEETKSELAVAERLSAAKTPLIQASGIATVPDAQTSQAMESTVAEAAGPVVKELKPAEEGRVPAAMEPVPAGAEIESMEDLWASVTSGPIPAVKDVVPGVKEPAGVAKKPAGALKKPAPGMKAPASVGKEREPLSAEPAPVAKEPSAVSKKPAPGVRQAVPVANLPATFPTKLVSIGMAAASRATGPLHVEKAPIPIAPLTDFEIDQILRE